MTSPDNPVEPDEEVEPIIPDDFSDWDGWDELEQFLSEIPDEAEIIGVAIIGDNVAILGFLPEDEEDHTSDRPDKPTIWV